MGSDNAIEIVNARSKAEDCFKDVLDFEDQDLGEDAGSDGKLVDGEPGVWTVIPGRRLNAKAGKMWARVMKISMFIFIGT